MTFLEAARLILEEAGQPLHYEEITRRAQARGLIKGDGATPEATMGSRLYTVTKEEGSGFARVDRGVFGLAKPSPVGIEAQVTEIYQTTRGRLRELLAKVPPKRFETLIKELLTKMGFDESSMEVTPYSGDGGIDVRGQYQAGGLAWINAAVQVKRWKNNVQAPNVTGLRGSLQVHQQGILITTSDFSSGAKTEASAPGKTRISLVNGEQLIDLLIRNEVGVIVKPLTVTLVDAEFWGEVLELGASAAAAVVGATGHEAGATQPDRLAAPQAPTPRAQPQSEWTGRKPRSFRFCGREYATESWKDLLRQVAGLIAADRGDSFAAIALTLHGRSRSYFTQTPDGLFAPVQVAGTDFWLEANQSAHSALQLIERMLAAFGYQPDDFSVSAGDETRPAAAHGDQPPP